MARMVLALDQPLDRHIDHQEFVPDISLTGAYR
jgi:hypothetical protein